jgi:hypothetical protein
MLEKQMQGLLFLEDSVLIIGDMEIKIFGNIYMNEKGIIFGVTG